MKYTVVWTDEAVNKLAALYLGAGKSPSITTASTEIDRLLLNDPLREAVVVAEGLYSVQAESLRCLFEYREADRMAEVVSVAVIHQTG